MAHVQSVKIAEAEMKKLIFVTIVALAHLPALGSQLAEIGLHQARMVKKPIVVERVARNMAM